MFAAAYELPPWHTLSSGSDFLMYNATQRQATIRFGEFELDPSGELRSGGRKIKLQEQPLQILRILIERSGEIVSREELQKRIWSSDTFVSRFNLKTASL